MGRYRVEVALAAAFTFILAAVWIWQNPGMLSGPLRAEEIDRYVHVVEGLPYPPEERAAAVAAARAWMEADDGKPLYMLNLMRYRPRVLRYQGAPAFDGSPTEANQRYEARVMPLLIKHGGYPAYTSHVTGRNLLGAGREVDHWSSVLLVRYPSRRAFMDLLVDPGFAAAASYKIMALQVVLTPTQPEVVFPGLTFSAGIVLSTLWMGIGWWRAARRAQGP